jgi:hypothetical protein
MDLNRKKAPSLSYSGRPEESSLVFHFNERTKIIIINITQADRSSASAEWIPFASADSILFDHVRFEPMTPLKLTQFH